jgi:hypothetical protein
VLLDRLRLAAEIGRQLGAAAVAPVATWGQRGRAVNAWARERACGQHMGARGARRQDGCDRLKNRAPAWSGGRRACQRNEGEGSVQSAHWGERNSAVRSSHGRMLGAADTSAIGRQLRAAAVAPVNTRAQEGRPVCTWAHGWELGQIMGAKGRVPSANGRKGESAVGTRVGARGVRSAHGPMGA